MLTSETTLARSHDRAVDDFDVGDDNLAAKDRIEKVQRYRWMLRTSKQQLECVVNGRIDANGHEGFAVVNLVT